MSYISSYAKWCSFDIKLNSFEIVYNLVIYINISISLQKPFTKYFIYNWYSIISNLMVILIVNWYLLFLI